MATDITTLLIQMIRANTQTAGLTTNSTVLGSTGDLISSVANYAQIFGTVVGPIAQSTAASTVGGIAAQQAAGTLIAGAAAQAGAAAGAEVGASAAAEAAEAAAAGGLEAGLAGAIVVLALSCIAALLSAAGNPGQSNQSQQFLDLVNGIGELTDDVLATYWQDKMTGSLSLLWSPVGTDLDNLAKEGTGGSDVTDDVSHFHDNALAFVNHLVKDPGSDQYWQVPAQPAGDIPQSSDPKPGWGTNGWMYESWYGRFPTRLTVGGSPSGNAKDPRTMAPVLALGIQSYLMLESLLNVIEPTQPTLQEFLNDFGGALADYTNFLYGNYELAVRKIVKTDLPSEGEILGTLWWITQMAGVFAHPSTNPTQPTSQSWGAPWPFPSDQPGAAFSGNGWAWNLSYGASETYPQYGFYGNVQLDQAQRNWFTPAYIVSRLDATNAVSQWQQALILFNVGSDTYVSIDGLENWAIPWLENRLILGRMARWKAVYLLNGFDGLWSGLQALQRLTPNLAVVPATMRLAQDDTIASGNWSARELCKIVQVNGKLLTGNDYVSADNEFVINWAPVSPIEWTSVSGQTVGGLVQFLYNVANGNWAGPPLQAPGEGIARPLSFRGVLAGAAA
jgi:hypothetical protein